MARKKIQLSRQFLDHPDLARKSEVPPTQARSEAEVMDVILGIAPATPPAPLSSPASARPAAASTAGPGERGPAAPGPLSFAGALTRIALGLATFPFRLAAAFLPWRRG